MKKLMLEVSEVRRIALLSQGSVIAFFAMTRGVVPITKLFGFGTTPPHDLDCRLDRAALLTQGDGALEWT